MKPQYLFVVCLALIVIFIASFSFNSSDDSKPTTGYVLESLSENQNDRACCEIISREANKTCYAPRSQSCDSCRTICELYAKENAAKIS